MGETVTMKGQPIKLKGPFVKEGDPLPDCEVTNQDLKPIKLSSFKGKPLLLITVPSLDTSVCSLETKKFNEKIPKFKDQIKAVVVSMDLPFAQKRYCGAENIKNLTVLSDYKKRELGEKLGILIEDLQILARCVFVCDANLEIKHIFVVKEITNEPDYDKVLESMNQVSAGLK